METSALLGLVAEVLETDVEGLSLDDSLDERDWDSLCNLSFIAEVDERFGLTVEADALVDAKTVGDLQAILVRAAA